MLEQEDLASLIQSHTPLIVVESYDEPRALDLLTHIAIKHRKLLFSWTVTNGLVRRGGFGSDPSSTWDLSVEPAAIERNGERFDQNGNIPYEAPALVKKYANSPEDVLKHILRLTPAAVIVLCDFHPYLMDKPEHVRLLKDIALKHEELGHSIVLLSHALEIPPELKRLSAQCQLSLPDDAQLLAIIRDEGERYLKDINGDNIKVEPGIINKLVRNLRGLEHSDARRLARMVIRNDGELTKKDLDILNHAKFKLLDMDGVITYEHDTESFKNVAGLKKLKEWIALRENAWLHPAPGTDRPRGMMLLGVQGSGKSLAARATAGMWGLPLLRLDMAGLFNKYIGETEKNLRESLKLAEIMSPCVLWIDEIEKGMATATSDDGTSKRMSGTLLTWMAENKKQVFIVATANNVSELPPELLRKGRLDEVFFVDLPNEEARRELFIIHLRKRSLDPTQFDMNQLLEFSKGFSGAEIVQAIVSAMYGCTAKNQALNTELLVAELSSTYPLSVLRAEEIAELRQWAAERTVMAN